MMIMAMIMVMVMMMNYVQELKLENDGVT